MFKFSQHPPLILNNTTIVKEPGPRPKIERDTPLDAFRAVVPHTLFHSLLHNAETHDPDNYHKYASSYNDVIRYFIWLIASGIVQYPSEEGYFTQGDPLLKNDYFFTLLKRSELISWKQFLHVPREEITSQFNKSSRRAWIPERHVAFDEGGVPFFANSDRRSYIPGKPHPNLLEFFALVDSLGWIMHIFWPRATYGDKYQVDDENNTTYQSLLLKVCDVFDEYSAVSQQSFVVYVDARFSSLESLENIWKRGYRGVFSISSSRRPKALMKWMKTDLKKRHWRSLFFEHMPGGFVVVRAKKNAYVTLAFTHGDDKPVLKMHRRRKFPATQFPIVAPAVQVDYNKYKGKVDEVTRKVMQYRRAAKSVHDDCTMLGVFIHLFALQAYTLFNHRSKNKIPRLKFLLLLCEQMRSLVDVAVPQKLDPPLSTCWPDQLEIRGRNCQQDGCRSKATHICKACDVVYCKTHMWQVHGR